MNNNVPDRSELFIVPPGKKKVALESKSKSSITFTFEREDHTLGNLIRGQLLKEPGVAFAGYIMPHPLDHYVRLNLQTHGDILPSKALLDSTKHLVKEIQELKRQFSLEIVRHPHQNEQM